MKSHITILAALALAFPLTTLAVESGHHHGKTEHTLQLNSGKKWGTDEALRKGMSSLRTSVASALPTVHAGKASAADYEALGKDMGAQVGYIVQNCKLEPKADAQLHLVIEQLVGAIDTVEGKGKDKNRAAGVVRAAMALNTYGKYFDHAGWQPIVLPH